MPVSRRRTNGEKHGKKSGFLARLLRDRSGNTLAIVGAALVPLAGIIGSGVDMSRAYMAKTRLQSACDSAALAGRRIMEDDTLSAEVEAEAARFFEANFPTGLYQTEPFEPVVSRPESGTVRVEASTRIPTAIMHLFGFQTLPISVSCDASLNFVNTDIILVLDVTGSMAYNVPGTQKTNVPEADQRITALREAVMALYDELAPIQEQLEANGLRLRFGVVPYSSTVNVGQLILDAEAATPGADYFISNAEYQTRVGNYTTAQYEENTTQDPPVQQIYPSSISQSDCDRYGRNRDFGSFRSSPTSGGGPAPNPTWTRSFSNNEQSGVDWGWDGATDTSGTTKTCRRWMVERDTTYTLQGYRFTNWTYAGENIDVDAYLDGDEIWIAYNGGNNSPGGLVPTSGSYDLFELAELGDDDMTKIQTSWNGCIEERGTVVITPDDNVVEASDNLSVPAGAFDLDIDLIPNSEETRWRPMWNDIVFRRTAGRTTTTNGTSMRSSACPAPAVALRAWTRDALETYINALQPVGGTYHDTGMLWGARLLSRGGIFAHSPNEWGGMPVSRHIIFMSDGQMEPTNTTYGLYGVEQNDARVTGNTGSSNSDLQSYHNLRFRIICNRAKTLPASIWTIALGINLTPEMSECASNPNQASTIASKDALIERFREIGSNIGALRLTQ